LSFNSLNNWFFNNFSCFNKSLNNDWYLNYSLDLFRYLSDKFNNFLCEFLDLLNNISIDDFLFNNFNFVWFLDSVGNLNNLLNNLRYFNNSFLSLDNNYWLFNNSVNDNILDLDVILNLFSSNYIYLFNNLLDYFLNLDNFWNTNYFLYYFLNKVWYFLNDLDYFLNMNNLLFNNLNLSVLGVNMIDNFTNSNWFLNFNNFFNESVDIFNFWYLSNNLDNSFKNSWNLDNFLNNLLDLNDFLSNSWDNNWNLNRYWNLFLDLSNFFNFNYLFNSLFNGNNLRNFN